MAARQALRLTVLVLTAAAGLGGYAWAADRVLADGGRTRYRIVISKTADVSTKAVAEDSASILKEITDADFAVVTDETEPAEHEIIVGADNARLAKLGLTDMAKDFGYLNSGRTVDFTGGTTRALE